MKNYKMNAQMVNDDLLVDDRTPLSIIIDMEEYQEKINDYREASLKFISMMSLAMSFILESKDTLSAAYGVCYALNLTQATEGKSMRENARRIGVSSGTISWYKLEFEKYSGITL
jgi:hypothetical protein